MKCKECGSEMLSTDRFCGICGAPNTSAEQNERNMGADGFSDILYKPEDSAPIFSDSVTAPADKPMSEPTVPPEPPIPPMPPVPPIPPIPSEPTVPPEPIKPQMPSEQQKMPEPAIPPKPTSEPIIEEQPKASVSSETPDSGTVEPKKVHETPKPANPARSSPSPSPAPSPYGYNYGTPNSYNYSQQAPNANKGRKKEKEKKVVSLSVAVLCIIAVFILAIICGVLMQMYINKGDKTDKRSGMSYSSTAPVSCTAEAIEEAINDQQTNNYYFL